MGRSLRKKYVDATGKSTLIADGTSNANISAASVSKYVRPMGRTEINNQLFNGYTLGKKAFYLEPFGVQDFTLSASDPNDVENFNHVSKSILAYDSRTCIGISW